MCGKVHRTGPPSTWLASNDEQCAVNVFTVRLLVAREFVADFEVATETDIPEQPLSMHLGSMLFEIAYSEVRGKASEELQFFRHIEKENGIDERHIISGKSQALMFPAEIKMGWLDVPEEYYRNLDQAEGTTMGFLNALIQSYRHYRSELLPLGYERRRVTWIADVDPASGNFVFIERPKEAGDMVVPVR